jgi:hypothetical protein
MNRTEAHKIFRCWQEYAETGDRFFQMMMSPPPSFLPYPVPVLEEALNIVTKEYFDAGNRDAAETIQRTMAAYIPTESDEEALAGMHKMLTMILSSPEMKKSILENLKRSQESWIKTRSE